jgi:hypothetical protein
MASFSPTEAAFEGFRLTREHPRAVVAWAIAYFAFTLGVAILTIAWTGKDFATLQALGQSANPDTTELLRVFRKLAPYFLVVLPLQVVFFAVLNCAIYRAVLRPEERGMGYFHLGPDEFRMVALAIIMFLLWLVAIFMVVFVGGLAAGTLGVFGGEVGAFVGGLVGAAAVSAAIWVLVRLSLAAPMTFDQRRLVVFGSWSFTRGAFWPLAGAYVLAFLLGVVILVLMAVISSALVGVAVMATGGSLASLGQSFDSDVSSVRAFLTLPTLLSQALSAGMITIYYVIVLSPSAIAYQGLAGHTPTTAQTFA